MIAVPCALSTVGTAKARGGPRSPPLSRMSPPDWQASTIAIRTWAPPEFWSSIGRTPADFPHLTVEAFLAANLLPVTIGNVIGGAVMVGIVYWFVYLRASRKEPSGRQG